MSYHSGKKRRVDNTLSMVHRIFRYSAVNGNNRGALILLSRGPQVRILPGVNNRIFPDCGGDILVLRDIPEGMKPTSMWAFSLRLGQVTVRSLFLQAILRSVGYVYTFLNFQDGDLLPQVIFEIVGCGHIPFD